MRRIVSDDPRIEARLEAMCEKFLHRGYPEKLVHKYRTQASEVVRNSLLSPKTRTDRTVCHLYQRMVLTVNR